MKKKNIEERIVENVSPLAQLLGVDRTDRLKDKICELIAEAIEEDLQDRDTWIITPSDVDEIAAEAFEEIRPKIKKRFKEEYLKVAEAAVAKAFEKRKEN